jgi:hypothetical protein
VLVIHDTTEFNFAGEKARPGLTVMGPDRQAFWMHSALAVSADGVRAPLGVLAAMSFVKKDRGEGIPDARWRERFHDPAKQSARWREGVTTVRARLGPAVRAIHLMDREGDSASLRHSGQQDESFIIGFTMTGGLTPPRPCTTPSRRQRGSRSAAVARRDVRHTA